MEATCSSQGDSEIDQLLLIFRLRGTPSAITWPEYQDLPAYRDTFIQFPGVSLRKALDSSTVLTHASLDLLESLLSVSEGDASRLLRPWDTPSSRGTRAWRERRRKASWRRSKRYGRRREVAVLRGK